MQGVEWELNTQPLSKSVFSSQAAPSPLGQDVPEGYSSTIEQCKGGRAVLFLSTHEGSGGSE